MADRTDQERTYSGATQIPARYMEEAKRAWAEVHEDYPHITAYGWRGGEDNGSPAPNYQEVATSLMYIDLLPPPIKTCKQGSYGMKHAVERWGDATGRAPYVANGAFIVAAIWRGIPFKDQSPRLAISPNIDLGIGAKHAEVGERLPGGRSYA